MLRVMYCLGDEVPGPEAGAIGSQRSQARFPGEAGQREAFVGCPFCELIGLGEVEFSEGSCVAFADAFPLSPGHTLVVPHRHEPDYFGLTGEELSDLWRLARAVCDGLREKHSPDGFNLGLNVGRAAGQTIDHVHLHVVPRYDGDAADPRGGVRRILPEGAAYWMT